MRDKTKPYGAYSNVGMPYGCLYLNNSGDRWITNDRRFILQTANGKQAIRLFDYIEALGNYAVICFRHKGKKYLEFGQEHDEKTGLTIVILKG
jgi:hypothetical protein